jgi:hypothetical protein
MKSKGPRFEILINGVAKNVIGIPGRGVLCTDIMWLRRSDKVARLDTASETKQDLENFLSKGLKLDAHASDSVNNVRRSWQLPKVRVGDSICFRILQPGKYTKPKIRKSRRIVVPKPPGGRWPPPVLPMFLHYGPSDQTASCRFEVSVNEEITTTAGIIGSGVVTCGLIWVKRSKTIQKSIDKDPKKRRSQGFDDENQIRFEVGGLDSGNGTNVFFRSLDQSLAIGDEIVIKILPPGPIGQVNGHMAIPFRRM